jgi:hypothetical protein
VAVKRGLRRKRMNTNEKRMIDAGANCYVEFEWNEPAVRRVYHRPDGQYDIMVKGVSGDDIEKMLRIAIDSMNKKPRWTLKKPLPFGSVFLMHNNPYDFYWVPTGKTVLVDETGYVSREVLIRSEGCLVQPCDIFGLPFIGNGMNDGEEYYTDKQLHINIIEPFFRPGEKVEFPYHRSGGVNYTLIRHYKNGWIMKKLVEKPAKTWKFKRGDRVVWGACHHGTIVCLLDEPIGRNCLTNDYKVCWDKDWLVDGAAEDNLRLE